MSKERKSVTLLMEVLRPDIRPDFYNPAGILERGFPLCPVDKKRSTLVIAEWRRETAFNVGFPVTTPENAEERKIYHDGIYKP